MKRAFITISVFILALAFHADTVVTRVAASGSRVDPLLQRLLAERQPGASVPAVITYGHMPGAMELTRLRSAGIAKGFALRALPMVIADLSATQLAAVRSQPGVVSVWANRVMRPFTNASRPFIGVPQLMADREVTAKNTNNPGFPISGQGIGIGYVDTGIDGTNKDLQFGTKTVQNVIQPLAQGVVSDGGQVVGVGVSISDMIPAGFVPPIYVENVPFSDCESGHGTFGSGVAAGLGVNSGGFYGGVARGAHLVGVNSGDDLGLPLVAILGAYDYLMVNQFAYNIRVINNSWGSSLADTEIDPNNPVNVATRYAHDRNITVVFAAGNSGSVADAINPYSTMAWTISVAAGEKQGLGTPAGFSSRGVDNGPNPDTAGLPADPNVPPNLRPDITAPGVDIKSCRTRGAGVEAVAGTVPIFVGSNDLTTIPPGFIPFYTTSQGTSFSCPHISGVVALMLEANPTLTPDDVVTLLRQTATPMPYEQKVVGAGYVDAHNAVRAVMGLAGVAHPATLFRQPTDPKIFDPAGDQLGTNAQDILTGDFAYDPVARQIVYTLTLADLSQKTPDNRWTVSSDFGTTTVFVTTAIDETGAVTFNYGKITTLATGTRNQSTLGPADSGQITGNTITVRVSVDKMNAAVGASVLGTTSTNTQALAQILIGTSISGGLLFPADSASGSDFVVGP
jgi:serine protease AprX